MDGQEAIDFLENKSGYDKLELPDLVLLDINLLNKNGPEALHYVKGCMRLKHIPVIMLTTSSAGRLSAIILNVRRR